MHHFDFFSHDMPLLHSLPSMNDLELIDKSGKEDTLAFGQGGEEDEMIYH